MGHAVQLAGSQFLNQGSNFRPLPWTHAVLTTRPPGRPQCIYFAEQQLPLASLQHTQLPWCMCLISAAVERLSQCGRLLMNRVSTTRSGPLFELYTLGCNKGIRTDTCPPSQRQEREFPSVYVVKRKTCIFIFCSYTGRKQSCSMSPAAAHRPGNWKPGSR